MRVNLFFEHRKRIAVFFLFLIGSEIFAPLSAYALTGGPSQPEVQAFEPANTNQMVALFTGGFSYNIPLGMVGAYPINISYNSGGVSADAEASWVGLGWSFNPGVITRNMRGFPDDFDGEEVVKEYNIKKNWTAGVDLGFNAEIAGFGGNTGVSIYKNNYRGFGIKHSLSFTYAFPVGGKDKNTEAIGNVGLGISFDSQEGVGLSPSLGLSLEEHSQETKVSVGFNYNSREGMKSLTLSFDSRDKSSNRALRLPNAGGSSISFATQSMSPAIAFGHRNLAFQARIKGGGFVGGGSVKLAGSLSGSYSEQALRTRKQGVKAYGYMYLDKANMSPMALLDFNREKDMPFRVPSVGSGDEGSPILPVVSPQFDLYNVSAQGIGGQYRAKRGDYGSVYDRRVIDESASGSLNLDFGIGSIVAVGADINITTVENTTEGWESGNDLYSFLRFSGYKQTDYEH
jgi:hypothetical protein